MTYYCNTAYMQGEKHFSVGHVWLSERRPGLGPRVGESVNPVVFPVINRTRAKSLSSLGTLHRASMAYLWLGL